MSPYRSQASRCTWVSVWPQNGARVPIAARMICCRAVLGSVGVTRARVYIPPRLCEYVMPAIEPDAWLKTGLVKSMCLTPKFGWKRSPAAGSRPTAGGGITVVINGSLASLCGLVGRSQGLANGPWYQDLGVWTGSHSSGRPDWTEFGRHHHFRPKCPGIPPWLPEDS